MGEFDIKYSNRRLGVASMNVTSLKKYEMVEKVAKLMEERKIDIACVQEALQHKQYDRKQRLQHILLP